MLAHLSGGDGANERELRQGLPVVLENHLLQDVQARVVPLHHVLICQRPSSLVIDLEPLEEERDIERSRDKHREMGNQVIDQTIKHTRDRSTYQQTQ